MGIEKILEQLHEYEKRIIRALYGLGKARTEEISEKTGLGKDEVEKATLWAKVKGAIETEEEVLEFLELTDEGREYVEKGLPEKNLIKLIDSGINEISKLKEEFERADIGIIWAKNYGWVEIKGGFLNLTDKGREVLKIETEGEKLLKTLASERLKLKDITIEPKIVDDFIRRGLARIVRETKREIFLTDLGKEIAEALPEEIEEAIAQLTPDVIRSKEWKRKKLRKYDIFLPSPKIFPGKIQPYRQIIDEVREKLIGLGFVEARGPLVELSFWNWDALFSPQDHPARGIHDTFFVKEPKLGKILDKKLWERVKETHEKGWITGSKGWGGKFEFDIARRLLLRSQGTSVSARVLSKLKKEDLPYKMFMIGRCFRPDVIDAKHFIEFEHCEGIVVAENLNFRNLLGYLKEIALTVGAEKIRFNPHYFPFTEPSVEGLAYYSELGWFEFGGAGIFRPEVTLPLGIDVPVLAWGLGIGRLAMLKLKVDDIRYLYSDNLEWLIAKPIPR